MVASKTLELSALIEKLGGFGRFQQMVFLLGTYVCMLPGLMVVNPTFVAFEPPHRCFVPSCESQESPSYNETFLNFTTPYDEKENAWKKCKKYAYIQQGESATTTACMKEAFNRSHIMNCSTYVYDDSMFTSSITTEFDLVCENSWLQPLAASVFMAGMLIGAILIGELADRIGRKKAIMASCLFYLIGGVISSLSSNYIIYLASRLITAIGNISMFAVALILALEFVTPEWRTFVGIFVGMPFAIGEALVAPLAYFIREWRWLQAACTVPVLLVIPFWWLLPESLRWLLSRGRVEEAKALVQRIEKMNKLSLSKEVYESLEVQQEMKIITVDPPSGLGSEPNNCTAEEKRNIMELFRYPNMRKRTINLIISWIVVTLCFYGLNMNSAHLGGDIFVNFALTMLIEIPSCVFAWFLLDRIGRKGTLSSTMILGGVASLLSGVIPLDLNWLIVTFSMVGKFGITACFASIYVYTAELYPTSYRSVGLGTCSMSARIGGIMAPFIAELAKVFRPLPFLVFAVLAITSGILIMLLPETLGHELPQTLKESEDFGKDQKICYFPCCNRKSLTISKEK